MGWADISEMIFGRGGSLIGTAGNAAALAADFIDDSTEKGRKSAGNAAMSAGGLGIIAGLASGTDSLTKFFGSKDDTSEKGQNAKKGAISGLVANSAGIIGGIADMIGGSAKKKNNKTVEKVAGWVSNIMGLTGSAAGIAQGTYDMKNARLDLEDAEASGDEDAIKKAKRAKSAAVNSLIGSSEGAVGGLFGLGGNITDLFSKNEGDKASRVANGLSKTGSIIGNGLGGLASLVGTFL